MGRTSGPFIVLALCLGAGLVPGCAADREATAVPAGRLPVSVSDVPEAVRRAVASELQKSPRELTGRDLSSVERLSLFGADLSDLSSLRRLTKLRVLDLRYTRVADLAPLEGLTDLWWLNLEGTQVADLAPVARLSHLTKLFVTDTRVSDLAPLAGLRHLRSLSVEGTAVTDLAPLHTASSSSLI